MAEPFPSAGVRPRETAPVTVREYGTRYLRITVRHHGEAGFSWLRSPGPAHTRAQRLPPATVAAALRRVDTAAVGTRLALGERAAHAGPEGAKHPDGTARAGSRPGVVYRVPGAFSVARLLPCGDETAYRLSVGALSGLGRTLRRLHQEPWDLPERPPHFGVRRLSAWLCGEEDADGASRLRTLARARLGPSLWTRLTDWSEAADAPLAGGAVLLHGAPSTGWLVPSPAGGPAALLTGEEVTGGDPALDLGWILGELHELRAAAAHGLGSAGQGPPVDYPAAANALLTGYTGDGAATVPRGTARAATLRLAVHMRDFASFVGWHEDLRRYCDLLAEALDEEGTPCLRWGTPKEFVEGELPGPPRQHPTHRNGPGA
ncbi:hypothetical protein [Streptomyces sp. NPDC098781]|uniref:hypothetical protein n=1 Tax=Streptomyces sp. NPDC098781 TaxID=3366097 RepID=UPI00382719A8